MKKEGEITDIKNHIATVRIYKDEEPTSLTIHAKFRGNYFVSDFVELEIPPVLFFIYTGFSYIFPFITAFIAYMITLCFTNDLIINQAVLLITLLLTYLLAGYIQKTAFFERVTVCRILSKIKE